VGHSSEDRERPTIARALDYLLRTYRDAEGKPVTVDRVAAEINTKGVSAAYINALRIGTKRNPTADTLRALASFFGVKAGFFFDAPPGEDSVSTVDAPSEASTTSDPTTPLPTSTPTNVRHALSDAVASQVNLAARLEYLFNLRVRPDGQPWSMRQVSAAAKAEGVPLSVGFLHDLRRGIKDNPTKQQLECLAKVFGVWPGYFFEEDEELERINQRLRAVDALDNERIASLALRARNLSVRELNMINALIDGALRDHGDES
jgi:transcriptional regulator with XRE-family HTH domain